MNAYYKYLLSASLGLFATSETHAAWSSWVVPIGIVDSGAASGQLNLGGTYYQNFDSLSSTGTSSFIDHEWWNSAGNNGLIVITGPTSPGYNASVPRNYGSSGDTDRAIGLTRDFFGVSFSNQSTLTVTGFSVSFDGEQWERLAHDPQMSDTLYFQYQIFDSGESNGAALDGWTTVSELSFVSPNLSDSSYSFLDGNSDENRVSDISAFVGGLTLLPSQEILFRWVAINEVNNTQGLAIDNVRISFVSVPEPAAASAILGALALLGVLLHARRSNRIEQNSPV